MVITRPAITKTTGNPIIRIASRLKWPFIEAQFFTLFPIRAFSKLTLATDSRGAVGCAFSIREPIEERVEIFQARVDYRRLFDRARDRLERFVAIASNRHDHG